MVNQLLDKILSDNNDQLNQNKKALIKADLISWNTNNFLQLTGNCKNSCKNHLRIVFTRRILRSYLLTVKYFFDKNYKPNVVCDKKWIGRSQIFVGSQAGMLQLGYQK